MLHTVKIVFMCAITWIACSAFHPYFVSTTEINYNSKNKTTEITCRMFSDNLEDALEKASGKKVDLLNPKDKKEVESLLEKYINSKLKIKTNGEYSTMSIIGYEKEEDAIWTYLEIKKEFNPKTVEIEDALLYELLPAQVNMVHATINGENRHSSKVTNPDKNIDIKF